MRQLQEKEEASLTSFLVGQQQLSTLHYIPDFISPEEEQRLVSEVHASKAKWVQLSGRRLQNHGGIVHTKGLIPAPMPGWLQQLIASLPQPLAQLFPPDQPPNHVLINSYLPGCGIMVGLGGSQLAACMHASCCNDFSHRPGLCQVCHACAHMLLLLLLLCALCRNCTHPITSHTHTHTHTQPHEDGPLYHPVVLILSLGSPAVLRFWRKQESGA
jgi:alkylated DNA repair dioxygenase AlkB